MISGINIKKNEKVSIKDMSVLAKEIINYLECKEYKILNDILKTFNFNDSNGTIIIGIVRYTYCERKKLPQWKWFLEKAIAELDSRNAIHSLRSIKVMTIDMYVDRLESHGRPFELDTNDVCIYDMEPFRKINQDAPGRIMFNHVFHDMIWIHLNKVINRHDSTYNEDAVNAYMNQLFEKYKDTFGTQLKHLYNDAIDSGYDFDKVLTLINYTGSIIEDLSDEKNRLPKGHGYQKIYDSDRTIFNQSYVYNFYPEVKEIINTEKHRLNIHNYLKLNP